jgi:glycosyltransferase involved in cell wall biosynthesis
MKIGMIIQRYGAEVLGGSEQLCRLLAEHLSGQHDIEVLTTCARDYVTWKNEYAEGTDRIRGVTVRRFASARTRELDAFNRFSDWIYASPHSRTDEMEWLKQQGPWCPALIEFVRKHHQQYDVLMFFTYLYAPTVVGLDVSPGKSVLVPTAHDEPAIRLDIFKDVFGKPAAICYLTQSERTFVQQQFPDRPLLEETIGVGVDLPQQQRYPRMPAPLDEESTETTSDSDRESRPEDEPQTRIFPSHLTSRGAVFRRRYRLQEPLVLYGGRIDPGKGCEELIQYFAQYVKDGGEATLALMGVKMMALPEEPFIRFAGHLSDRERVEALEAATVVVCPSPYESLSLLALEALSVGTPILVNARSEVLVEHCKASNGGLWYADRDEFVACLQLLIRDARLRETLGRNGRAYVRRNYRWEVVLGKLERIFARVRNGKDR